MAVVHLTSQAREDIRDLDGSARKAVIKALAKLRESPEQRGAPLGSQKDSNLTTFRKLVVGDRHYRIVYRVEADGTVVVVWVVGARADRAAYELAQARLKLHAKNADFAAEMAALLENTWATALNREP